MKNFGPVMNDGKMNQQSFKVITLKILKMMTTYHFNFKIQILRHIYCAFYFFVLFI